MPQENEKTIYQMFRASILLKGAISLAEMVVGGLLLFVSMEQLITLTLWFIHFFLRSWSNILSTPLLHFTSLLTASSGLIAFYLFSRGAIKLVLIIALLYNRLWAYPWSLVVLSLFVVYQIWHMIESFSGIVLGITLFDLVVMYFIWREYRIVQKHLAEKAH